MALLSAPTVLVVLGFTLVKCWCATINEYGEYEKVTVAVSPHINTLEIKSVLQELEAAFRDASRLLYSASKGHFSFKEVIFIVPKISNVTWTDKEWISGQVDETPDIFILEEGLFRDNMYTIQHKGCGEQGLRINLPVQFLMNATDKSKAFVHEWAHYRYGVFDEHGFINDPVYPLFQSIKENLKLSVTGCTNQYPSYQFINKIGQQCQPLADDCFPVPKQLGNENIRSSLMHKPFMPKVNQFCDDKTHDRKALTKQNTLCKEQSTWKVISTSTDFTKTRFTRLNIAAPTFRYMAESTIRLVFAIDTKNLKEQSGLVRNAFAYFVLFDLPNSSQVSIVDLKTSKATDFFSIGSETQSIFDVFPDVDETEEICVHCSILTALDTLKQNDQEPHGVVLLATASDISPERIEIVRNAWPTDGVKLFVIFCGSSSTGSPLLETLTAATGGQLFFIQRQQFQKHSFLSPLTLLYEAFRSVYEYFSWTFRNIVLIDQKIVHNDSNQTDMSFAVDENIEVIHVLFTGADFHSEQAVWKDKIILKPDDVEYVTDKPLFSHKAEIPAYIFTIRNPQVGRWTLSFQRKPKYTKSFEIMIRGSNSDYRKITNARCSISINSKDLIAKPMTVYGQIYRGFKPVIKSISLAFLYHQETNEETIIKLIDNGAGDPDITKNDGIYTRYITGITKKGFYTLTVVSKGIKDKKFQNNNEGDLNNCCGSTIPETLAATTTIFSRIVTYGSFYLESEFLEKHLPPRRIVDLHMIGTEALENYIKHYILQWTAPGAHLDSGTATNYEMKIFQSRHNALNNFENSVLTISEWHTHGEWLKTEVANTIQTVIIELRDLQTGTYFLAMRAVNEEGNAGAVSNVVELYFTEPPSQTRVQETSTNPVSFAPNLQTSSTSSSLVESKASVNDAELGIIIGVTCGILFLFLVVGFILLIHLSKKRKLEEKRKKQRISPPYFPRKVKEPDEHIYSAASIHGDQSISYTNPASTISEMQLIKKQPHNSNYYPATLSPMKNLPMDNVSVASRVYTITSDQSSFYDVPLRDEINIPFNPTYTSSLRRLHGDNMSYRLGTDV